VTGATDNAVARQWVAPITWVGLFVALFGMLIVRQAVNHFWPDATVASAVTKEAGMWIVGLVIIVIVKVGEGLPLSSIGLGTCAFGNQFFGDCCLEWFVSS
jgi:hypothetical protein